MKSTHASSLALITTLTALVTADALPAEDIPVQCATICGPIVELTAACNVHGGSSSSRLRRRRVDGRAWVPKLAVEPEVGVPGVRADDRVERRFEVIVQAPTSFPPDVLPSTTLDLEVTSRPTRITPSIEELTSTNPLSPSSPPAATTTAASEGDDATTLRPSTTTASTASVQTSAYDGYLAEQKGWAAPEGAEEQCVCLNTSFDVASVTALCASCVSLSGDVDNNVDVITSTCNFSALNYVPADDAVVNNVRVQATRPSQAWGENAALDGAAGRVDVGATMAMVVGVLGVVLGGFLL